MLEKLPGNILAQKPWAILLLDTDFNAINKIIFNTWAMPSIELYNKIPSKIVGSRKSQSFLYLALRKKLIADILNQ